MTGLYLFVVLEMFVMGRPPNPLQFVDWAKCVLFFFEIFIVWKPPNPHKIVGWAKCVLFLKFLLWGRPPNPPKIVMTGLNVYCFWNPPPKEKFDFSQNIDKIGLAYRLILLIIGLYR